MENLNSRLNVMITALNKIQSEISQIKENAGKTTQGKMQEKIDYFSRRTNKLLSENGFENDEKLNGNYSNCDINEESGNECNYRDCGEDDGGESCVRGYKGCQNNIGEGRESKVNKNSYENIKEKYFKLPNKRTRINNIYSNLYSSNNNKKDTLKKDSIFNKTRKLFDSRELSGYFINTNNNRTLKEYKLKNRCDNCGDFNTFNKTYKNLIQHQRNKQKKDKFIKPYKSINNYYENKENIYKTSVQNLLDFNSQNFRPNDSSSENSPIKNSRVPKLQNASKGGPNFQSIESSSQIEENVLFTEQCANKKDPEIEVKESKYLTAEPTKRESREKNDGQLGVILGGRDGKNGAGCGDCIYKHYTRNRCNKSNKCRSRASDEQEELSKRSYLCNTGKLIKSTSKIYPPLSKNKNQTYVINTKLNDYTTTFRNIKSNHNQAYSYINKSVQNFSDINKIAKISGKRHKNNTVYDYCNNNNSSFSSDEERKYDKKRQNLHKKYGRIICEGACENMDGNLNAENEQERLKQPSNYTRLINKKMENNNEVMGSNSYNNRCNNENIAKEIKCILCGQPIEELLETNKIFNENNSDYLNFINSNSLNDNDNLTNLNLYSNYIKRRIKQKEQNEKLLNLYKNLMFNLINNIDRSELYQLKLDVEEQLDKNKNNKKK